MSTISLQAAYDACAAKSVFDPRNAPSGYGDSLALELGSEVMADLLGGATNARGEVTRFNWKFNRGVAAPFQLNSWQQDYPQPAQAAGIIGWGEECDILDINNTVMPKPLNWDGAITWRRQLAATSRSRWRPGQICWMYNSDLNYGTWPGPGKVFSPLTGSGPQNPIMSMVDAHGNLLIVTGFGTTGLNAPLLAASSPEGTPVTDGTVTWTVVSPASQGFRVDWLPNATSPNYQILPYFQIEPPRFSTLGQLLTPIPDSFSRHFFRGLEAAMLAASPNPGDMKRGQAARVDWLTALLVMTGQANKEPDAFGLIPMNQVVERRWQDGGPYTADRPV
ncbi:MAG: hypothetical protein WBQ94_04330 [Terracidiphilus sp.]